MRVLLVDCRDSFTYNLAHSVRRLMRPMDILDVVISDFLVPKRVLGSYDRILLSPGPGVPGETPNLLEIIEECSREVPILGICLGHQAIAQVFGAKLINLKKVFHGIKSTINLSNRDRLFAGLPPTIDGGRYHSWVVSQREFPSELEVTATCQDGSIMAFSHKSLDIHGLQFHPESILTPEGPRILENFLYGRGVHNVASVA
ncbi:MAG: aminodeoxychorismate/anthranilate synthase component II [Deltaproteobacteria bacterium]|jgi:anthranilate synthase component 2|nr:aminodeoxychorismate/anthranilate synthase component II [Deltaproteobacteria bacterium]